MKKSILSEGSENLLEIRNLVVHYETHDGVVEAVNNIDLDVRKGHTLGLVGETGAGKSTIALSIMGLLPVPPAHMVQGSIKFEGEELIGKTAKEMRGVRGEKIGMIFQDPMTALNPTASVGEQIAEALKIHYKYQKNEAMLKAMDLLKMVGIAPERYKSLAYEFSGGMKQRVVIAMALACNPQMIIADEPTTALDVTIQAQILDLMKNLRDQLGTSLLLITHDFGVVAEICDECAVIYAGEIVEKGSVEDIFDRTAHPYTIGLFHALPRLDGEIRRLQPIPGLMANPMDLPPYCSFADRCPCATEACRQTDPALQEIAPGHFVKCIHCQKG